VSPSVLVVDDEPGIIEVASAYLRRDGFVVRTAATGQRALDSVLTQVPDLIVLDLMLPDIPGEQVCASLRRHTAVPILMLTAKSAEADRVRGLALGADDYLVKPFAFAELLARLRALVRRGRPSDAQRLSVADLEVDRISRQVTRGGRPLDLTVREFELLEYLVRHHAQVVSRETLARDIWKETSRTTPLDNVIDVHIARLRRKVDGEGLPKLIHTVRGVGFMLREGEP
jgi:DNA-binding response OmpR family regulator